MMYESISKKKRVRGARADETYLDVLADEMKLAVTE